MSNGDRHAVPRDYLRKYHKDYAEDYEESDGAGSTAHSRPRQQQQQQSLFKLDKYTTDGFSGPAYGSCPTARISACRSTLIKSASQTETQGQTEGKSSVSWMSRIPQPASISPTQSRHTRKKTRHQHTRSGSRVGMTSRQSSAYKYTESGDTWLNVPSTGGNYPDYTPKSNHGNLQTPTPKRISRISRRYFSLLGEDSVYKACRERKAQNSNSAQAESTVRIKEEECSDDDGYEPFIDSRV